VLWSRAPYLVALDFLGALFFIKIARCLLKLVQFGKTIQYVFILEYSRNYKTLCDRKKLADGRGGPWQRGAHGINGTMVNPALLEGPVPLDAP